MFVVEFGLFSTTFKRVDGQTVIAPNALLANTKTVHNLRRSNSMYVTLFLVHPGGSSGPVPEGAGRLSVSYTFSLFIPQCR